MPANSWIAYGGCSFCVCMCVCDSCHPLHIYFTVPVPHADHVTQELSLLFSQLCITTEVLRYDYKVSLVVCKKYL